ncbi:MAG: autotransporter [Alphaproteobacteria bacterium PA2]|nr:MAG: autotransporter [Alphaproteobacteria bacterium PA2]
MAGLLLFGALSARFAILSPQGRLLVEAGANGLKLGRIGKLKVEGVEGDLMKDFRIRRLTIVDEKGVWLDARALEVSWRYMPLLTRKLHIDRVTAQHVTVLRRPSLTEKQTSRELPVSIQIDAIRTRLEMLPEFSVQRGVFDLDGQLAVRRAKGGFTSRIKARSLLHAGDHLALDVAFLKYEPLRVVADASESRGGALAGALGLPSDRPFELHARAGGAESKGKLHAVLTSGPDQPVTLDGVWTDQGGQGTGRVSLTASTLTRNLAQRLGSEARLTFSGFKADQTHFNMAARMDMANLTLTASGRADLKGRRLGPQGMDLVATSPALSKITGGPSLGPARVAGRLAGMSDDWRFAGTGSVGAMAIGDYRLGAASGPLTLTSRRGELGLTGKLVGSGGQGSGYLFAMLGAAPKAEIDLARLSDGRLALKDLKAQGSGLTLSAQGGRSLFGGLTLKGKAVASNLTMARLGAKGAAEVSWTADQGGAGKPWNLSLDGKGQNLATGYPVLDRLLGPAPRLAAQGGIGGGRLTLTRASLDGAALDATGQGQAEFKGPMKFDLGWSADGPFRFGPLEITGRARGSGTVAGTLSEPRADLSADFEAIDIPKLPLTAARLTLTFQKGAQSTMGAVALNAASAYGPASARANFGLNGGDLNLTDLVMDAGGVKASGDLALRPGDGTRADLKLNISRGALIDGGDIKGQVQITDAPGGPRAKLALDLAEVILSGQLVAISAGRLTADGPLSRLPYDLQANGASHAGKWSLTGGGLAGAEGEGYRLGFEGGGRLGVHGLKTTEPAAFTFEDGQTGARIRLATNEGGKLDIDGRFTKAAADFKARLSDINLGVLDQDLTGKVDADLSLSGQGGRLTGDLNADLLGARGLGADKAQGLDGKLRAHLAGDQIQIDSQLANSQGLKAQADLVLPAETSAAPFRIAINRQKPLRGRAFADGEVKPLWDLLIGGDRELAGHVHLEGQLGGTLADLGSVGQASVDNGRFSDGASGLVLRDVALQADLADQALNIAQVSASDGHGGGLSGQGRISLLRDGDSSFRLDLKGFRLIDNDLATASATGQATINRNADGKVKLSGALAIDRADVSAKPPAPSGVTPMDVVEINRPVDLTPATTARTRGGQGVLLAVSLKAPRRIYLRGRGLDAELSLDAHVGGSTSRPSLTGVARVVRGDYDFAGKRFAFDERGTVRLATDPKDIRLDLTASRDDTTLMAAVQIRGTAARPEITLTSTPTLPNDEVLSQVLFGRSASQLTPVEAAQLASALSSLAGGGGFDVIGNLKTFAGLDRLALGGGGTTGVTVSGGKYLTDDVYLEITGGGREGPSAQVEWRINRALSLISKLAGQGDGKLAVRWRKDY